MRDFLRKWFKEEISALLWGCGPYVIIIIFAVTIVSFVEDTNLAFNIIASFAGIVIAIAIILIFLINKRS
ncbi:hypothetical protein ACXGQP_05535 [Enterobacter oligotrophicus]